MTRQEAQDLKRQIWFSGRGVEPVSVTGRGNNAVVNCVELGSGYPFTVRSAAEWANYVASGEPARLTPTQKLYRPFVGF